MRHIIVVCCALFVLSGCGTVAKEVTPQTESSPAQSVTINTAVVPQKKIAAVVSESVLTKDVVIEVTNNVIEPAASANVLASENVIVVDVSGIQTPIDALLASRSADLEYAEVPEGVLVTVEQAKATETVLYGENEVCQVYLPAATEILVSVDPGAPEAYAAAETKPMIVVY